MGFKLSVVYVRNMEGTFGTIFSANCGLKVSLKPNRPSGPDPKCVFFALKLPIKRVFLMFFLLYGCLKKKAVPVLTLGRNMRRYEYAHKFGIAIIAKQ